MKLDLQKTGLDPERLDRIGAHLDAYVDAGKLPGYDVAVMRRGRLAYRRIHGKASVETGAPLAEDTVYRIYSMTKPITSVALMQLYEQARFQLDEPVTRFFPEWARVIGYGPDRTARPSRPNRPTVRSASATCSATPQA